MVAKLGIVEEECDETGYWLELIVESGALPAHVVAPAADEAHQILAMTVASIKTLRARSIQNPKSKIQNDSDSGRSIQNPKSKIPNG